MHLIACVLMSVGVGIMKFEFWLFTVWTLVRLFRGLSLSKFVVRSLAFLIQKDRRIQRTLEHHMQR